MKIRQTVQHFAAKKSLELPIVRDLVKDKLVDLHVRVFLERAPEEHREDRRERLQAFFQSSIDAYRRALQEGYSEARAREITHIQANLEFYRLGWTEMMEFPPEELEANVGRYEGFFDAHSVSLDDPLGDFGPDEGLPEAEPTPAKRRDPETPYAEEGFADAMYVEDEDGRLRRDE